MHNREDEEKEFLFFIAKWMVEAERGFNLKGGTYPSESESDAVDLSAKKEQRVWGIQTL